MEDPAGVTSYSWDVANRLHWLENPLNERATYGYDGVGRATTMTYATGSYAQTQYDAAGRIEAVRNLKSDDAVLSVFTYSYDAAGNRTEVQEANADRVTWSYDDGGQLTRERRSGANAYEITYSYDEVGNRLTKVDSDATTTYSYDGANQLTAEERPAARLTYSYDANGNLELVENDEALTTYSWDIENHMVGAELPDATLNTMSYDGDGRRRTLEDSDGSRDIVWDGENVLRELEGENVTAYTHNPQGYGELISQRRSGATAFHHYDALGSTDRLTDTNEGVSASYLYKAFGEQSVLSGSHANRFTWVGRLGYYRQGDMGNYWLRARTYSQLTGRFLSRDPLPNGNLYIYPANSPVVLVDPSGMQGYRGPRRRPEPVEAPTATVARRYGPGRFHRPHPPRPPEPPEPLEPEEPEDEEPVVGDGGGPVNGERLACRMRTPGEKRKKAYGYGYRWVCQCPNQEHWECSMPTGWGPPKAGRTKKGNKFVKDLWPTECRCSCPDSCGGTVNMRRREWRGDSDELVSEVERQKEVKGRCVTDPTCGPDVTQDLLRIVAEVHEAFRVPLGWAPAAQCVKLVMPPWAWNVWDIPRLISQEDDQVGIESSTRCPIGPPCRRTVTVDGSCFYQQGVEWLLYGLLMDLCEYSWETTHTLLWLYRGWRRGRRAKAIFQSAVKWAKAGWLGWPNVTNTPVPDVSMCLPCDEENWPRLIWLFDEVPGHEVDYVPGGIGL